MVCTLNSVYGNSDRSYAGISSNGKPTVGRGILNEEFDSPFETRLINNRIVFKPKNYTVTDQYIGVGDLITRNPPFYFVVTLGRPKTTMYVASGPRDIRRVDISAGDEADPFSGSLVLGRSLGDTLHTADMAVMELGIYADRLTPSQVRTEISLLSSVYGADS